VIGLDTQPEVLHVVIGGFCGGEESYAEFCNELQAISGHPAMFVPSSRWRMWRVTHNPNKHPKTLLRQARHALSLIVPRQVGTFIKTSQHAELRLHGHSMGAAVSLIVALLFHQHVREVTLYAPACMYKYKLLALASRAWRKGQSDAHMAKHHEDPEVRRRMVGGTKRMLRYAANLVRTLKEGIALANSGVCAKLIPLLAAHDIKVFVVYADQDELFPVTADTPRLTTNATVVAGTTHDIMQLYPKQAAKAGWSLRTATP
jgi:pimeloyl-ACP methyl ester carboxylesterase